MYSPWQASCFRCFTDNSNGYEGSVFELLPWNGIKYVLDDILINYCVPHCLFIISFRSQKVNG